MVRHAYLIMQKRQRRDDREATYLAEWKQRFLALNLLYEALVLLVLEYAVEYTHDWIPTPLFPLRHHDKVHAVGQFAPNQPIFVLVDNLLLLKYSPTGEALGQFRLHYGQGMTCQMCVTATRVWVACNWNVGVCNWKVGAWDYDGTLQSHMPVRNVCDMVVAGEHLVLLTHSPSEVEVYEAPCTVMTHGFRLLGDRATCPTSLCVRGTDIWVADTAALDKDRILRGYTWYGRALDGYVCIHRCFNDMFIHQLIPLDETLLVVLEDGVIHIDQQGHVVQQPLSFSTRGALHKVDQQTLLRIHKPYNELVYVAQIQLCTRLLINKVP